MMNRLSRLVRRIRAALTADRSVGRSAPASSPARAGTPTRPGSPTRTGTPARPSIPPRPGPPVRPGALAARPGAAARAGHPARPGSAARNRILGYAPNLDGDADPGEIVWTWVPYEEDPRNGKDRPVLVVGRDGATVYGLMLSSRQTRQGQRNWYPLGRGDWDGQGRPSWVRLDRVLTMPQDSIRREGAVLDRARFDALATTLRSGYGWS